MKDVRPVRQAVPEEEVPDAKLDSKVGIRGHVLYHRSESVDCKRAGISHHNVPVQSMEVEDLGRHRRRNGRSPEALEVVHPPAKLTFCPEVCHR